ncbi:HAD family hydrolase [Glycocaulis abyssi]|uniref:HAD family hydrolase n=1 Tax=Glycocaulis abyssi TaxID=1433403 RepID=A0ABV9NBB2_9PROT
MAVRAILWDLGRTLADWDPDYLYRRLIPDADARRDFLSRICTMDWHEAHDRGVSMADNREALIARHPGKAALIKAWDTGWNAMFNGYVEGMEGLVEALHTRGVPQYALSNMPAEKWPEVLALYPAFTLFETALISGQEGLVKPDPAIYALAISRIGTPPHETLFIDDRLDNIEAGAKAGFAVHHFAGAPALRAELDRLGLLPLTG